MFTGCYRSLQVITGDYVLAGIREIDEETVDVFLLMISIFVGDSGTPHTPAAGEEPSPAPWNQMHRSIY